MAFAFAPSRAFFASCSFLHAASRSRRARTFSSSTGGVPAAALSPLPDGGGGAADPFEAGAAPFRGVEARPFPEAARSRDGDLERVRLRVLSRLS